MSIFVMNIMDDNEAMFWFQSRIRADTTEHISISMKKIRSLFQFLRPAFFSAPDYCKKQKEFVDFLEASKCKPVLSLKISHSSR